MSLPILIGLIAGCAILMVLERLGLPTTLSLQFKGDIKRETRWLAQYGQFVCTAVAIVLVYQLDRPARHQQAAVAILVAVLGTSVVSTFVKRIFGRIRPGREHAGKFLGPSLKHANFRESFPSSHSACAVALSVVLARLYPEAIATFWALALICAVLRYIMDAHWPSDVLGGIALGYALANVTANAMHLA